MISFRLELLVGARHFLLLLGEGRLGTLLFRVFDRRGLAHKLNYSGLVWVKGNLCLPVSVEVKPVLIRVSAVATLRYGMGRGLTRPAHRFQSRS